MALNLWIPSRDCQCLEWARPQLLEVTLDFFNMPGEVEGEPQVTLSLQEQPIDINQSMWCIGTQRESSTSKQTCNISSMKTTSLSVATKKHISNQTSFKVRGYQCFRSDRIGRSNGGILTLVRNEEGFSYEVGEPLLSNDKAQSLNASNN